MDLQTIALVLRAFFSLYQGGRREDPDLFDYLLSKCFALGKRAGEVLRDSVTSQHAWRLADSGAEVAAGCRGALGAERSEYALASKVVRDTTGSSDKGWWLRPN